ncbi:sulfotransferase, partial [Synechococcus sp. AH-558-M21]|nr:sulfotransferase [Synechococcus sp. AH-558-M21]
WRHWRGRINHCPPFHQLLKSKVLKQRVVEGSFYHKQLMRYRQWFPAESIHCLSTEELTAHPIKSLNAVLKFLGQPANASSLLVKGSLPLTNPAGSKGRRNIEPPQWTAELKKRTIDLIQPDSEEFLKTIHWPKDTWQWD